MSEHRFHRSLSRHTRVSRYEDVCTLVILTADKGARFTQVRGPRRGETLNPACLVFISSRITMDLGDPELQHR